jgi:hypothetical protein
LVSGDEAVATGGSQRAGMVGNPLFLWRTSWDLMGLNGGLHVI